MISFLFLVLFLWLMFKYRSVEYALETWVQFLEQFVPLLIVCTPVFVLNAAFNLTSSRIDIYENPTALSWFLGASVFVHILAITYGLIASTVVSFGGSILDFFRQKPKTYILCCLFGLGYTGQIVLQKIDSYITKKLQLYPIFYEIYSALSIFMYLFISYLLFILCMNLGKNFTEKFPISQPTPIKTASAFLGFMVVEWMAVIITTLLSWLAMIIFTEPNKELRTIVSSLNLPLTIVFYSSYMKTLFKPE